MNKEVFSWKVGTIIMAVLCIALTAALALTWMQCFEPEKAGTEDPDKTTTTFVSGIIVNDQGQPVVASVEVVDLESKTKIRRQTDLLGRYEIELPLGEYEFTFSKGFEYERESLLVSLQDRLRYRPSPVTLSRTVNWNDAGWYCGDLHQHTSYSDGYQDVGTVFLSDLANGLDFGFVTDHNSVDGLAEWSRGGELMTSGGCELFTAIPGMEVTTEMGHYNSLGTSALVDDSTTSGKDDIQRIADDIHRAGGIAQINHPFLTDGMGFTEWSVLNSFDTYELWNGKGVTNEGANLMAKEKWFSLLNDGIYLPATAGSDNHDVTGNYPWRRDDETSASKLWIERGLYSGMPRNYVYCPEGADADAVLSGILAGNSFITNGPLIDFRLGKAIPGEQIPFAEEQELMIHLYDQRGLESAVLLENGIPIHEFSVENQNEQNIRLTIPVKDGSWYVLEVTGSQGGYAITNPVFVGSFSGE